MNGVNQKKAWKIYHEKVFVNAELTWDMSESYIINVVHLSIHEEWRGYRAKSSIAKMLKSVGEAGINLSADMINRILVKSVFK